VCGICRKLIVSNGTIASRASNTIEERARGSAFKCWKKRATSAAFSPARESMILEMSTGDRDDLINVTSPAVLPTRIAKMTR
jgi:hypothetical protein